MPRFDGTGPLGKGAMTGGGRGFCVVPLSGTFGYGSGAGGFGAGRGRGRRHCFYATGLPGWMRAQGGTQVHEGYVGMASKETETAMLQEQAESLKKQLEDTQERIREIEKDNGLR